MISQTLYFAHVPPATMKYLVLFSFLFAIISHFFPTSFYFWWESFEWDTLTPSSILSSACFWNQFWNLVLLVYQSLSGFGHVDHNHIHNKLILKIRTAFFFSFTRAMCICSFMTSLLRSTGFLLQSPKYWQWKHLLLLLL